MKPTVRHVVVVLAPDRVGILCDVTRIVFELGGNIGGIRQTIVDGFFNLVFTVIFAVELLVNLYAHWFWPFVTNGWSLVDTVVVSLSLAALGPIDLPVTALRMMRAFRVIRLFGRLKALKKMIAACLASVVPMLNAFLIMVIIACICEPPARAATPPRP